MFVEAMEELVDWQLASNGNHSKAAQISRRRYVGGVMWVAPDCDYDDRHSNTDYDDCHSAGHDSKKADKARRG